MAKQIIGIDPTIINFHIVLIHELTRWDIKQKDNNIYRIGHLITAADKVREDMGAIDLNEIMTQSVADLFIASLGTRFEKCFSPINKTVKQITNFLATGKRPSLK